ncbi:MAG: TrbI/VirB10 family protein [Vampirovibrionales bacterium]|nr:TrbI/VirB10 family protein [Vampirovibrionales bacterium]
MNFKTSPLARPWALALAIPVLTLGMTLGLGAFDAARAEGIGGLRLAQLQPLQGRVVTAPAGTAMTASLQMPLSSETARPGDRFTATLGGDIAAGGSIVLPAGSQLEGQVFSAQAAGRAGRNGMLDVRFTSAITPGGQRVPLSARIQTEDGSGILKGGTAASRAGKAALRTGLGAGLGAALGTAMGPLSGGRVGRGAIYGTAVGGGLGALYAGAKKGEDAILPAGQTINITLDSPLTVTPGGAGAGSYDSQPYYNYGAPQQPYNAQPNGQPYNPPYQPYGGQSAPNPYTTY